MFRNKERFKASEGYYHTLITSAVDFIEKIGPDKLDIKKEEFETKYVLHEKLAEARVEEELLLWRYGSAIVEKTDKAKENQARLLLKDLRKTVAKSKSLVAQNFDKLTVAQLRQLVETQAEIIQKLTSGPQ